MTTTPSQWNATPSWISACGADHDVDRAVGEPGEHVLALGAGDPVREQLDAQRTLAEQVVGIGHADAGEQRPHAGGVLLGQHLGRRHQRALVPALHRGEQRRHGHDRLAGADVALQQPVHRVRDGEVGVDLGDRPPLGAGERERQRRVEAPHELAADLVRDARAVALERALAQHQHQLDPQQLVERQPAPGLLLVAHRLGQVDLRERHAAVDEREPLRTALGHRVGDAALVAAPQRLLDQAGDLPRGQRAFSLCG